MQFVTRGPDVPEQLLQAHEDGQVVFFCGAGVSVPAGLPTFDCLVKEFYKRIGIEPNPVQARALAAGHYDTAVGLLEADARGGRQRVRQALVHLLEPNLAARDAIATHAGRSEDIAVVVNHWARVTADVRVRPQIEDTEGMCGPDWRQYQPVRMKGR